MYVLHHADQPELYHGLKKDPQISPVVSLWKGILKPLSTIGLAASVLFGFFHYIGVGPNKAEDDDEEDKA
jgi:formate dehydrogenase iron-sulfur subunit